MTPQQPIDPTLAASAHPWLSGLLWAAFGVYLLTLLASLVVPRLARGWLLIGIALHLAAMVGRGLAISFFPLTNKLESFSAAALALAVVAWITWRPSRLYVIPMTALTAFTLGMALKLFALDLAYPPPLMQTIWYPLHVPLAFVSYALWAASAAAGFAYWGSGGDLDWLHRIDRWTLQGFAVWSVAMVTGGVWGVVAWGAYFMWDPKVIWSVILWFFYASFIHVRLTPSLAARPWVRPALAVLGFVWVLVAYIGTSFFFGKSSHAFG